MPTSPPQDRRSRLRCRARDNYRYGYWRFFEQLTREPHAINHKRVQHLCRDEGLRVQVSRRKRARLGTFTIPRKWLRADFPNYVRA
jgi:hypothetical protein